MNTLWIMVDQLRYDYVSCYGARHIHTPNIDRLAARGVKFDKAYVQSPLCTPSRMSYYTGRYVGSHGVTWNGFPLKVGEPTLGDHLRALGVNCSLIGKTHMVADKPGMARLGIDPQSLIGRRVSECGFDVVVRDDGTNHTAYPGRHAEDYDAYLRSHGMGGDNPWEEWANTGVTPEGEFRTGWLLDNAPLPARVPKEHSETAWLTTRGIEFIDAQGDQPWLCHLSYIKPHWPFLVPAPYNDLYGPQDLPAPNRSAAERDSGHPLLRAWIDMRVSKTFADDAVRDRVAPVYMGLIKELDDQLGRLFDHLEATGRMEETMIVFTSDHGDNMGDHWMGEKDMFYDSSARVPFIIYDPRAQADATRGTTCDALVEGVDLVPTFLEAYGGAPQSHLIEGRSLQPWLQGETPDWREVAVSEYDYCTRAARRALGVDQADARLVMVFDGRWKYVHVEGMRPMLFDLDTDPGELTDLGDDPAFADQIARLKDHHFAWARRYHARTTLDAATIEAMTDAQEPPGIFIGYRNQTDLEADGHRLPPHVTG